MNNYLYEEIKQEDEDESGDHYSLFFMSDSVIGAPQGSKIGDIDCAALLQKNTVPFLKRGNGIYFGAYSDQERTTFKWFNFELNECPKSILTNFSTSIQHVKSQDVGQDVKNFIKSQEGAYTPENFLVGWDDDVHKYDTREMLNDIAFKFANPFPIDPNKTDLARDMIADACVFVDYNPLTQPADIKSEYAQGFHFDTTKNHDVLRRGKEGDVDDQRVKNSTMSLITAINLFNKAETLLDRKKAFEALGTGLHPLQDIHAHSNEYVTLYESSYRPLNLLFKQPSDKIFYFSSHANWNGYSADDKTVKPERYHCSQAITYLYGLTFAIATKQIDMGSECGGMGHDGSVKDVLAKVDRIINDLLEPPKGNAKNIKYLKTMEGFLRESKFILEPLAKGEKSENKKEEKNEKNEKNESSEQSEQAKLVIEKIDNLLVLATEVTQQDKITVTKIDSVASCANFAAQSLFYWGAHQVCDSAVFKFVADVYAGLINHLQKQHEHNLLNNNRNTYFAPVPDAPDNVGKFIEERIIFGNT